jgi:pyrimidine deaminase RibD-like protein
MQLDPEQKEIFEYLLEVGGKSKDPEGVVAACLVNADGEIIFSSPSADDGIRHAEDLVIKNAKNENIDMTSNIILYTTLEPCSQRTDNNIDDCTTRIINSGIKKVIIGARDPEWSLDTKKRFEQVGIEYHLVGDQEIVIKCINLFNSTIRTDLERMNLPRKSQLGVS